MLARVKNAEPLTQQSLPARFRLGHEVAGMMWALSRQPLRRLAHAIWTVRVISARTR